MKTQVAVSNSKCWETSLVVQWLRLSALNAGGLGSTPSQGTRSHKLQLRVCLLQLKIPHAMTKMEDPLCLNKDWLRQIKWIDAYLKNKINYCDIDEKSLETQALHLLPIGSHGILNIFPGGTSGKEHACQNRRHRRCRFDPWVGKIPWRRVWQPAPVFLPGESHGQRYLAGYSP